MKRKKMDVYRYSILMFAVCFALMGFLPMAARAEEETWIVVFDANGGNCGVGEIRVPKGESITLPEVSREGYRFDGWMYMYDKEDGTVKVENQGKAGAVFTPREFYSSLSAGWYEEFTLTFDACGGECLQGSMLVIEIESVTLPEAVREGCEFTGWYGNEELTEYIGAAGDAYSSGEDKVLYAGWREKEKQKYTITFNAGEGECSPKSVEVEEGESATLPEAVREGYEFTGWYEDEGLTKYIGTAGDPYEPEEGKTLYAGWKAEEKEKQKYTVTFNAGEGECSPKSMETEEGKSVTLPEAVREGYEFTGWYEDEGLTKYIGAAGDLYEPEAGKTLYAGWKEAEKEKQKYTVTFNAGEGKCSPQSVEAEEGESITLPEAVREGYEFTGWYEDEGLTKYIGTAGDTFDPEEGKTLYAGWKKAETAGGEKEPGQDKGQKVTIIFHTGGGSRIEPVQAVKGDMIKLPSAKKEGAVMTGWYTEKDGGNLLGMPGDSLKATEDLTVYAVWEKKEEGRGDKGDGKTEDNAGNRTEGSRETSTTVFSTDRGSLAAAEVIVAKGASLYLPLPECEGYEFLGWYLDKELTRFAGNGGEAYRVMEDTCFYARWKKTGEDSGKKETEGEGTGKEDKGKDGTGRESGGAGGWETDKNAGVLPEDSTDSSREAGNGAVHDTGNSLGPVIQTGHLSPAPVFCGMGLCGILLFLFSLAPEKRRGIKKDKAV